MNNTTPETQTTPAEDAGPQGPLNLDLLCFQKARDSLEAIRMQLGSQPKRDDWKAVDRAVTETLGVLQEDGTFACAVFISWRIEREQQDAARKTHVTLRRTVPDLVAKLYPSLAASPGGNQPGATDVATKNLFTCMERLADDLDQLLLGCQVLERFLIYMRYLAKGQPKP